MKAHWIWARCPKILQSLGPHHLGSFPYCSKDTQSNYVPYHSHMLISLKSRPWLIPNENDFLSKLANHLQIENLKSIVSTDAPCLILWFRSEMRINIPVHSQKPDKVFTHKQDRPKLLISRQNKYLISLLLLNCTEQTSSSISIVAFIDGIILPHPVD